MEALYTKYRPNTFAEVRGQEHATDALIRALESNRVHHAYLFSGPRGCGKTSSARILAASINCEQGPTPNPCGVCVQCVDIRKGISLDVIEIDAASNGSVDDARDLRERVQFAPSSARCKIYIIDEAHMLSSAANNALLKVVEEPPPHVRFIFATTEPDKILPTIRSRTFHYHFRLVPPRVLTQHLQSVCDKEGVSVDPAVLPLIVAAGGGSVRDSMSILDQLIAGAGDNGLEYAPAVALLGVTDAALLDEACGALAARDGAGLLGAVDRAVSAGHDPRRFATDLLGRIRDLLIIETVPDADERGLLEGVPVDARDRFRGFASALGGAELSRMGDALHAGLIEMRGTTNPRLLLELICARMLVPGMDAASVAVRLERLERGASVVAAAPAATTAPVVAASTPPTPPTAPAPTASAPAAPEVAPRPAASPPVTAQVDEPVAPLPPPPVAPATPASAVGVPSGGAIDFGKLQVLWPQIVEATKSRKRATHALLSVYARLVAAEGNAITLHFELAPIARQYNSGVNIEVTREAIHEVLGIMPSVTVVIGDTPPAAGEPAMSGPPSAPVPVEDYDAAQTEDDHPPFMGQPRDEDSPSMDDEDLPSLGSGDDAALEALQAGLGATIVSRSDNG